MIQVLLILAVLCGGCVVSLIGALITVWADDKYGEKGVEIIELILIILLMPLVIISTFLIMHILNLI